MLDAQPALRKQIDRATTPATLDGATDLVELALVAHDVSEDDAAYTAIIAQIPPLKLAHSAKGVYRVVGVYRSPTDGCVVVTLVGGRGGHSSLVQNARRRDMYAHVTMSGRRGRTVWYRRSGNDFFPF